MLEKQDSCYAQQDKTRWRKQKRAEQISHEPAYGGFGTEAYSARRGRLPLVSITSYSLVFMVANKKADASCVGFLSAKTWLLER
jgi:hypothetical protein